MSYEVWGEPDDSDDLYSRISDAGGLVPEEVDDLRTLLQHVEFAPCPGSKSDAALILIDRMLNPPRYDAPEDPHVTWARHLLKDDLACLLNQSLVPTAPTSLTFD